MIHEDGASFSPGAYAGIPALILLGVLLVVAIGWQVFDRKFDDGEWGPLPGFAIGATLVALVIGMLTYYPFSSDFHKYYPVTGTVQTVDSRLIGNGDSGVSQRFVVVLKESGQPFAIDDTRATLLKPGDSVNLRCKREFEFNSVPGWGCKWNSQF